MRVRDQGQGLGLTIRIRLFVDEIRLDHPFSTTRRIFPTTSISFQLNRYLSNFKRFFPTSNRSFQLKTFQLNDFSNYSFQLHVSQKSPNPKKVKLFGLSERGRILETNEIWDRTYHVKVREKTKEKKILQFMMPKTIEKYVRNTCQQLYIIYQSGPVVSGSLGLWPKVFGFGVQVISDPFQEKMNSVSDSECDVQWSIVTTNFEASDVTMVDHHKSYYLILPIISTGYFGILAFTTLSPKMMHDDFINFECILNAH